MERPFTQREWHHIPFSTLRSASRTADPAFYHAFYERLLGASSPVDEGWVVQKQRMGRWLLRQFLNDAPVDASRVLSIGAWLGVAETEIAGRGFSVDVLEVEPTSIRFTAAGCRDLRPLVGDARSLPLREGRYDLALLAAVDYVFARSDYIHVLAELRRVIKPAGHVVVICLSNLSLIGMARGLTRRRAKPAAGEVAWGYQRTVGVHVSAGRCAGLRTESVFRLTAGFDVTAVHPGGRVSPGHRRGETPPWASRSAARE